MGLVAIYSNKLCRTFACDKLAAGYRLQQCRLQCGCVKRAVVDQYEPIYVQVHFILKLARLCHAEGHSKQEKSRFKQELNAVMGLAKTMNTNFTSTPGRRGPLNRGAKLRAEQLRKMGYLVVKRPKLDGANPPLYPLWQGKPLFGPSSATPQAQPLPPREAATAASSGGDVPFIPGPAKAPVSLKFVQTQTAQKSSIPASLLLSTSASLLLSTSVSLRASLPGSTTQADATASKASGASAGVAANLPLAQTAPLSLVPSPAPIPATLPQALTQIRLDRPQPTLPLPPPPSSGPNQLPILPPAVPTAPNPPDSSDTTAQLGLPLPMDATAALVAAVGPLFEAFVAQTAAVVDSPDMPMQALVGQVTQDLAAAIATAAMQVVDARRQQGNANLAAVAAEPQRVGTVNAGKAESGSAVAPIANLTHAPKFVSHSGTQAVAESASPSAQLPAASQVAKANTGDATVTDPVLAMAGLSEEPSQASVSAVVVKPVKKVTASDSKQSRSSHGSLVHKVGADTPVKASKLKQVSGKIEHVTEAKACDKGSDVRHGSNSPPSISAVGLAAKESKCEGHQKVCEAAQGTSKAVSGLRATSNSDGTKQHKGKSSKKRSTADTPSNAAERAAKRPHELSSTPGGSLEYEGYVVPGLDIGKYEAGRNKGQLGKAQVGNGSRQSSGAHQQGLRESLLPGSPHSRSSRSSGRSSPKEFGPLSAAVFDGSNSSRQGSRSPREPSRLNVGSLMQDSIRRDFPAIPSRMGGPFPSVSPVLPSVLPFDPSANIPLRHGFGAPDFRPDGHLPGREGGWQHPEAHHFDSIPLPDISFAPDFTPHFLPGGPAN